MAVKTAKRTLLWMTVGSVASYGGRRRTSGAHDAPAAACARDATAVPRPDPAAPTRNRRTSADGFLSASLHLFRHADAEEEQAAGDGDAGGGDDDEAAAAVVVGRGKHRDVAIEVVSGLREVEEVLREQ